MKVKLTKINQAENAEFPAGGANFQMGEDNPGVSLPVDYELVVDLQDKPKVGDMMTGFRYERNGMKYLGYFASSIITKIEENKIYTKNSIYKMEKL